MEIHHMIRSPKERFQESQIRTQQWAQIVANPLFDEACDVAFLQMQEQLPMQSESHLQNVGAQRFIRILKTIHEKTEQPKEQIHKDLNYQAGV